jgi:ATP-dependent Lon protease
MTGKTIKDELAMTGELDLVGKVMPIGGLKEKVLAARRNQIKTNLIPKFNKRDLDELDAELKEGITFHSSRRSTRCSAMRSPDRQHWRKHR